MTGVTVKKAKTGGRRKGQTNLVTRSARQKALKYSTKAIETLAKIMAKSESDQARTAAAKEILDRAHGKAPVSMELTGHDGAPLMPSLTITVGETAKRMRGKGNGEAS